MRPPAKWLIKGLKPVAVAHRIARLRARPAPVGQAVGAEHQHVAGTHRLEGVHIGPQRGRVAHQIGQRHGLLQHAVHPQLQAQRTQPGQAAEGIQRHHLAPDAQEPIHTTELHRRAVIALVPDRHIVEQHGTSDGTALAGHKAQRCAHVHLGHATRQGDGMP
jgi:hypothetical protein